MLSRPCPLPTDDGLAEPLLAKKDGLEFPYLGWREPRESENLHSFIRDLRLVGRQRWWLVPAQTSANIRVDAPARGACELVSELVQLAHLLEQRLELRFVDRCHVTNGTAPSRWALAIP